MRLLDLFCGTAEGCFIADADAIVLVKGASGEWPEWALRAMGTGFSADILDALLAAIKSNEGGDP